MSTKTVKRSFLRRTKATAPPDSEPDSTTAKYTRRLFKSRSDAKASSTKTSIDTKPSGSDVKRSDLKPENGNTTGVDLKTGAKSSEKSAGNERTRRPSLSSGAARSERPRNFVRRRIGGANVTTTSAPPASQQSAAVSRRPFRIASRRRPVSTTTTAAKTTTAAPTTTQVSEDSLQDIGETDSDSSVDTTLQGRTVQKSTKIQRRPLLLKEEALDQNPSATNEERKRKAKDSSEEEKRQSKKYSSNRQNQLEKSKDEGKATTERPKTTIDDFSAETALAIATHQLLSAPLPSIPNYDDDKPHKKTTKTYKQNVDDFTQTYKYSSTPIYKTSEFIDTTSTDTGPSYVPNMSSFTTKLYSSSPSPRYSKPFTTSVLGLSTFTSSFSPSTTNPGFPHTTFSSPELSSQRFTSTSPGFTSQRTRVSSQSPSVYTSSLKPSTDRYVGSSDKLIPVPVVDYSFSTDGYSSSNFAQEPAYFTREYLLESPVTKTYDDEYQYLSPVTTSQSPKTTRPLPKKTVYKKISTTLSPAAVYESTSPKPRRVTKNPFEKIPFVKSEPGRTYRPTDNYDYYDEGDEKMATKYEEGTQVIVHAKGKIQCLDIGNFPHPTSCKKFISCARLENGSILGWAYICPKGLSFDPVGGICNWSAGLGCDEKDF